MIGAAKKKSLSPAGLTALRVLLLLVVTLFLPQTRVWGFGITSQPASGVFASASPLSIGENYDGFAYDASGSPVAAKTAPTPTRFINGVRVTDRATGNVLEGTVDLKPTLDRIASGQRFPHRNDGSIFRNDQSLLPKQSPGYYTEYVHPTPGVNGPGPQRIVTGQGGEFYYTPDHYRTFIPLNP